jgi:hypothetical protein
MMPAQPAADLVVVQAWRSLALREHRCYWPPHARHPDQRGHRYVRWRVTARDLERRGLSQRPPQDDPHVWARQSSAHRHAAWAGELGPQRPCAALYDQAGLPPLWGPRCSMLIDPLGHRFPGDQMGRAWLLATARPRSPRRRWPCQPDLRAVGYCGGIPHCCKRRGLVMCGIAWETRHAG